MREGGLKGWVIEGGREGLGERGWVRGDSGLIGWVDRVI